MMVSAAPRRMRTLSMRRVSWLVLLSAVLCDAQLSTSSRSRSPTPTITASTRPSPAPPAPAAALGSTPSGLSPTELAITYGFSETVSSLSFMGSAFILFCYARYAPLRKFSFTLIALLSATDVLNQLFDFVGPPASELAVMEAGAPLTPRCLVQALGNQVFELSSVLWTGCIAWTLYALVWKGWRPDAVERSLPRMFAVTLGAPVLLMLLSLIHI